MRLSKFSMRLLFLAIFIVMTLTSVNLAGAQTTTGISASANKQSYELGDTVTITGTVNHLTTGNPVTIIVRNPIGNVYDVDQVQLTNNSFVHSFILSQDAQDGIYTANIKQGSQTVKIQFHVTGTTVPEFGTTTYVLVLGVVTIIIFSQVGIRKFRWFN